ncbi:hypothetical protein PENSPDRAFT_695647 [Peniophora sp. CONT]|nr:hypothetical protein PENSPDRAFT_695647 [Peniophora sp. CONT]
MLTASTRTTFPRSLESRGRDVESLSNGSISDPEDEYEMKVDEHGVAGTPVHSLGHLPTNDLSDSDEDYVGVDELTRHQRSKLLNLASGLESVSRNGTVAKESHDQGKCCCNALQSVILKEYK